MSLLDRLLKGPYPFWPFLLVVAFGAAAIAGAVIPLVGWATYQGHNEIPGAVHISETLFTGFLITFVTGIVLHRHATIGGICRTLEVRGQCPFPGIFILGLALGGVATAVVVATHGTGPVTFHELLVAKLVQGLLTGFAVPFLFHAFKLLRHPRVLA